MQGFQQLDDRGGSILIHNTERNPKPHKLFLVNQGATTSQAEWQLTRLQLQQLLGVCQLAVTNAGNGHSQFQQQFHGEVLDVVTQPDGSFVGVSIRGVSIHLSGSANATAFLNLVIFPGVSTMPLTDPASFTITGPVFRLKQEFCDALKLYIESNA